MIRPAFGTALRRTRTRVTPAGLEGSPTLAAGTTDVRDHSESARLMARHSWWRHALSLAAEGTEGSESVTPCRGDVAQRLAREAACTPLR